MRWSPISAKCSPCCGRVLRRPQPFAGPGLPEASPIRRLNLPLPSAITMSRRCSLQLALRAGMLGSEAKVG